MRSVYLLGSSYDTTRNMSSPGVKAGKGVRSHCQSSLFRVFPSAAGYVDVPTLPGSSDVPHENLFFFPGSTDAELFKSPTLSRRGKMGFNVHRSLISFLSSGESHGGI
jgi:hypothetical protein